MGLSLLLAWSSPVLAADAPPEALPDELGYGWLLVRTLLVLGIVIAIVYLTLNVGLRRLMGVSGVSARRTALITVLERVPLDTKRALYVVRAPGACLLVGGTEASLSVLATLDPQAVAEAEQASPPPAVSPLLSKLLARRKEGP